METNFISQLKSAIEKADKLDQTVIKKDGDIWYGGDYPRKNERPTRLFHIYKETIPPTAEMYKDVVVWNVIKDCALMLIDGILKARSYNNDERGYKTFVYYEPIPVDAKPHEKSIYFNGGPTTRPEGSDKPIKIERGYDDPLWVG